MDVYREMVDLVPSFARDVGTAKGLSSPNPEDDLYAKLAIVGFSYTCPTEEWGRDHFNFLKDRLGREFDPDSVDEYGENGQNVILFYSLCIGYLLGLYKADLISDAEFLVAEAQLAGLIAVRIGELTSRPL